VSAYKKWGTAGRPRIQLRIMIAIATGRQCFVCGNELDPKTATIEHAVSRMAGGSNAFTNLRLSHARCNWNRGHIELWTRRCIERALGGDAPFIAWPALLPEFEP